MRAPNPDLEIQIRAECLKLLLEKEPEQIGMRDIASACGISPTSIYYYYKDKGMLFEAVKLDCLSSLDSFIEKKTAGYTKADDLLRAGMCAFRDWCFENPRIALLVMGRLKAATDLQGADFTPYYRSTYGAKAMLDRAVAEGLASSADTLMDASLFIAAIWGAVESILLNRTVPDYWYDGVIFTDRMIALCCSAVFDKRSH